MNYVPNQNGKVLEETLAGSNSDAVKTTLRHLRSFKMTLFFDDSLFYNFFKNLFPFLCHLTLPHRNSCIETHFVLLAKIIEHAVFQSPHCFVLIEAV